ncbi:hypothetical protein EVC02_059 [Rhizobium phage RHph_N17]|nr:hypothetical protein EVC02_059 [Rhizobium phage RHph_N17]
MTWTDVIMLTFGIGITVAGLGFVLYCAFQIR